MIAAAAGLLGLAVGSFLNVVIHRVPRGESLVRPRSRCPSCRREIASRDNVPLVSWVLLRGRCRHCGVRIPARYPVVEALTAALFAGAFLRFGDLDRAAFAAAASAVLVALAFIDLDHRRVPNRIVLPATAVAGVWVVAAGALGRDWAPVASSLGSGAAGFGLLFAIAFVSGGMGFGDVKLAGFIGIVLGRFGWGVFLLGLFAGFVAGGLVAMALLATGRASRKAAIPFAPMLCAGALIGLFVGPGPVRAWWGG